MRPPSYYSSLAHSSQPQRGSTNSSLQLRSSFSSPSSSSYATRSHLPFVSQSMLVAHCYTGTTRPYGSHSTASSTVSGAGSSTALGSYNNSYSRPRSTKHSNPYLTAPTYSSSTLSPSSATSRYLSGASSSSLSTRSSRPAYAPYRSSYASTSSSLSPASYYKPIRLRERPLLNQISRQINSSGSGAELKLHSETDERHSSRRIVDATKKAASSAEQSAERQSDESWQSDVARNISRNKYLIKFREIDKRPSPTPIQLTNRLESPDDSSLNEAAQQQVKYEQVQTVTTTTAAEPTKAEKVEERASEEIVSASMKVPTVVPALVERLEEKPRTTCSRPVLSQIENEQHIEHNATACDNTSNGQQQAVAATGNLDHGEKLVEQNRVEDANKSVKKKVPRENKKNIKLKLKSLNKSGEQQVVAGVESSEPRTTSKVKKVEMVSLKQSAETEAPSNEATSPAIKTKVKKLVKKTSKRAAEAEASKLAAPEIEDPKKLNARVSETSEPLPRPDLQLPVSTNAQLDDKTNKTNKQSTQLKGLATQDKIAAAQPKLKQPKHGLIGPERPPVGLASPEAGASKRIRFREYHIDDFNFLSVLGHGGWGFVILADLKQHDACFAVKCIKKITIVEDDDFDSIMIERKVLTLGNVHPFICKLFCTFETEGYLFFVMEYCPGGDLMFHVQKEGKFTESRCRFYAAEIICAIRFLHNQHIIYRDLKLDNILLDSQGHIRLVDFGMCQCRTYREEMLPSNFCGTPEYISPEIIKGVPYNHSVDWWSFGVLLYEMAVGKMPFRGSDENELLWNVCYEQIHYPMFLTKELSTLLQSLLEREPTKRMGMASCKLGDIYDQAWFRGVDWVAIEKMRVQPPFVPEVLSKRDVQNFDADFTESAPELSPVDEATLNRIDQKQFQKFPYTNPNIFIFD